MEELQYFERIEDYIDGNMSPEARQLFEADLQTNPQLQEEYEAMRATMVALEWMVTDELQQEKKSATITPLKVASKRSWWMVAAGFLLLILLGGLGYANLNYSNQKLAQKAYTEPIWTNLVRGENNMETQEINEALANEHYGYLNEILEKIPEKNVDMLYLSANAWLKNKHFDPAIERFQQVVNSPDQSRKAAAEWYLVLAYLEKGDTAAAQEQIDRLLQQSNHPNRDKLLELNGQLNSPWRKLVF